MFILSNFKFNFVTLSSTDKRLHESYITMVRIPKLGCHIIRNVNKSIFAFLLSINHIIVLSWNNLIKVQEQDFSFQSMTPPKLKRSTSPPTYSPTLCCSIWYRPTSPSLTGAHPPTHLLHPCCKQMLPTLRVPVTQRWYQWWCHLHALFPPWIWSSALPWERMRSVLYPLSTWALPYLVCC